MKIWFWHKNIHFDSKTSNQIWHENMIFPWFDIRNTQPLCFRPYHLAQSSHLRTYAPSCPKHIWRSLWYPLVQHGATKAPPHGALRTYPMSTSLVTPQIEIGKGGFGTTTDLNSDQWWHQWWAPQTSGDISGLPLRPVVTSVVDPSDQWSHQWSTLQTRCHDHWSASGQWSHQVSTPQTSGHISGGHLMSPLIWTRSVVVTPDLRCRPLIWPLAWARSVVMTPDLKGRPLIWPLVWGANHWSDHWSEVSTTDVTTDLNSDQ